MRHFFRLVINYFLIMLNLHPHIVKTKLKNQLFAADSIKFTRRFYNDEVKQNTSLKNNKG